MARAYRIARDHVDDIVALVTTMFAYRRATDAAERGQISHTILDRIEQIEASLALARRAGHPLPLDRLQVAFKLEAEEIRCLYVLIALAVSSEVRALAGSDGTGSIELLDKLVYTSTASRDRFVEHLANDGKLFGYGLVELVDETRSRFARPLRVADRVVDLAFGRARPGSELGGFAALDDARAYDLLVPDTARTDLTRAIERQIASGYGPVPVVRGATGSGRRALISTIAKQLGLRLLVVKCGALPERVGPALTAVMREAIISGAVIVLADAEQLAGDPASGRRDRTSVVDATFAHYSGPLAITASTDASGASMMTLRGIVVVDLPQLVESERATLWSRHLPAELATEVAARYRVTGGQIERAAIAVAQRADGAPDLDVVHEAIRGVVDDKLTTLGVRVEWKQTWADLVLPDDSFDELREMVARVQHRRRVIDEWGFGAKVAKGLGVAAMFSGPPGTGKTMAAGLVAKDLGLDLYQIDLSRMVSKYIGETEKNLAQVFEAAETGHAVLLFDEADSMFAKRTEVKSSVDRYANLEVNYLLQRMEAFTGITILTTNNDSGIDQAFLRRLAFRIQFPMPEEDERKRLWRAVIPPKALAPNVEFTQLAERFVMSGGYIKNAAVRAAYLAAGDGSLIEMRHLVKAAAAEYAAMGKVMTQGMTSGLS